MLHRILFLCTGNYYRSRYAEILFNDLAAKAGIAWRAESRGLATEKGMFTIWILRRRMRHWGESKCLSES